MKDHPELKAQVAALYHEATAGNSAAFDFLWAADGYLGEIATLVAKPEADHKEFVRLLAKTNLIYGLPFYLANSAMLFTAMQNALHGILQAVTCPGGADEWQKDWARTAGLVMADVTLSVATIVIGFEKAAALRPKIQEVAWATGAKPVNGSDMVSFGMGIMLPRSVAEAFGKAPVSPNPFEELSRRFDDKMAREESERKE